MAVNPNGSGSSDLRRRRQRRQRSRVSGDAESSPRRRAHRPVLDQAIAINGDLRVQLFGFNLLPIRVRLLVSSKDVAAQLGLDWWRPDSRRAKRRRGVEAR